jgi:hypothetical protein
MKKIAMLLAVLFFLSASLSAQWQSVGGQARDVGVGANGTVWVIGWTAVPGGYNIARWNGNFWENIPGGAVRIDVDPNGNAWVVNDAGFIFRWNGQTWQNIGGQARDVGIGADGTVWVIGWTAVPGGYNIARWNGNIWEDIPGGAVRIDVDPNGRAWAVNDAGLIFRYNGRGWDGIGGQGRDISISADGTPWLVGWVETAGGYYIYRWSGSSWQDIPGGLTSISAGRNTVWGVNDAGLIFWQNNLPPGNRVMTRFNPTIHGFKFENSFSVQTRIAGFNGPTFGGLCGGMVYAALDYYHANRTIPQQDYMPAEGMPLQSYLSNRQLNSAIPNGDKWIEYGFNPGGARNREFFNWGLQLGSGRLGELKSKIDRGEPVPLGLWECGNDCGCPGGKCPGSHQVLAIGYEMGRYKGDLGANIEDLSIFVYDPNYPNRTMTLRPHVDGAMYLYREEGQGRVGACRWRAYFTDMKYARATPPVIPNNPNELVVTFRTGGDDLRGGNDNVHLVLLMRSGATIRFDNVNDSKRWADGSTQPISRPLAATFRADDFIGVRLETTFGGGIGGDNWNLDGIKVQVRSNGVNRDMYNKSGTPLFRFTGDQRTREFRF